MQHRFPRRVTGESLGLLAIALVALEIAQTVVEEEVVRRAQVSAPTRVRRYPLRFAPSKSASPADHTPCGGGVRDADRLPGGDVDRAGVERDVGNARLSEYRRRDRQQHEERQGTTLGIIETDLRQSPRRLSPRSDLDDSGWKAAGQESRGSGNDESWNGVNPLVMATNVSPVGTNGQVAVTAPSRVRG